MSFKRGLFGCFLCLVSFISIPGFVTGNISVYDSLSLSFTCDLVSHKTRTSRAESVEVVGQEAVFETPGLPGQL